MFPCFCVLGGPQGPVFCVFVFWAGTTGLCFVFSCFGRPPSKHSRGPKAFHSVNRVRIAMEVLAQAADLEAANDLKEEAIKELIHDRLEVVFVPHDCRLADISRPNCFA